MTSILPFLAEGITDKDAVQALIELGDSEVNYHLTSNPTLTESQIDTLLKVGSPQTRALTASRLDLTDAQRLKIINSDGQNVCESALAMLLLPTYWMGKTKLSDEIIKELLSKRWLTPSHANFLLPQLSTNSAHLREVRDLSQERIDNYLAQVHEGWYQDIVCYRKAVEFDKYYRVVMGLKPTPGATMVEEVTDLLGGITEMILANLLHRPEGKKQRDDLPKAITDAVGRPGKEFYTVLFSLLTNLAYPR